MTTETITITQSHEQYIGAQDVYKAELAVHVFKAGTVLERHEEKIPAGCSKKRVILSGAKGGISNLRLSGDWISAEFEVGHQRFDKIYPFMGHDGFWFTDNGRAFPALEHHEVSVLVEVGPCGASISWDIVEVPAFDPKKTHELYAVSTQFCGDEVLKRGKSQIRLNYNHPVFGLYVKTDKPVKGFHVLLDGKQLEAPFIWKEQENRWECIFQEIPEDGVPQSSASTINFSRVDSPLLIVDHDCDEVTVHVWATNANLVRIMMGMAGMAFSK